MNEKTAELFTNCVDLGIIHEIKPFKNFESAPYIVFDVRGTICYDFNEALQTAIKKHNEFLQSIRDMNV